MLGLSCIGNIDFLRLKIDEKFHDFVEFFLTFSWESTSNMPILIINQDDIFLKELQNAFEGQGYQVVATTDSRKALKLFFQHRPTAVVLDVCMPNKDGFEITKEIRGFCKKTFILAVSANQISLRAIKKLGANVALSCLIEPTTIVSVIKAITKTVRFL